MKGVYMADILGLSTPWVTFAREIDAIFSEDPEVTVVYQNDNKEIKIYVDNYAKADAIAAIIPQEKTFGNVTVKVIVIPSNEDLVNRITLFRNAFAGNPILNRIETVTPAPNGPVNYVIFNREILSFFNDDLSDFYGAESTLAEDIARDVFDIGDDAICFCTEVNFSKDE